MKSVGKKIILNLFLQTKKIKILVLLLLNRRLVSLWLILFCINNIFAQPEYTKVNSAPGAFSRMGFGARGIAMGNAISAIHNGNLVAYYNPALSVFQEKNSFNAAYTFLSLDRSLNFLNFTRRFDLYSQYDSTTENRKPRSSAGISLGVINAGVSKIDAIDNQGFKTGDLSTSENQFFVSVANKFSSKLAIGINAKFYYHKLYKDITTTSFGLDVGAIYLVNNSIAISFVLVDMNSKYKWDTNPIYEANGTSTTDKFPFTKKIGISYNNLIENLLLGAEFVFDNEHSQIVRFGTEYNLYENLFLRAGFDNWFINNSDQPVHPSFGFGYSKLTGKIFIGIDYAYVLEQYAPNDRHIIGVNILF